MHQQREAPSDDLAGLTAALTRYSDVVERQLAAAAAAPATTNRNEMRVERSRDTTWVAVCLTIICAAMSWNTQQRAADLRIDLRASQTQQAVMNRWIAQEVTALRSYITTGKLAPMVPPPTESPSAKETH